MPVIMIHSLELTEKQKKVMAKEYTRIMSELTNVPEERIYCFFSGYPLDGIAAGGMLNSEFPDSALKQFNIKYTEDLIEKEAIRVASRMKVKPGKEQKAWEELTTLLLKTRNEEGCLGYDLYRSKFDLLNEKDCSCYFLLREKWKDQDAIAYHTSTDFFKTFMAQGEELFEGAIEVTKCIDSLRHNDNVDPRNKFLSIMRIKAKPGKQEVIQDGLVSVMNMMCERQSCKAYDVFQGFEGIYDPSVFLSFQIWDSMEAFKEAGKYLASHMPFSFDDLADPRQPMIFEMISQPQY